MEDRGTAGPLTATMAAIYGSRTHAAALRLVVFDVPLLAGATGWRVVRAEFGLSGEAVGLIARRHRLVFADLSRRPRRTWPSTLAFPAELRAQPERTIAAVGADFGLRAAAARRLAAAGGFFRQACRAGTTERDAEVLRRFESGHTASEVGQEFGLSSKHIRHILQAARASRP